ncbi:NADH:ubiquinone oxidoreductase [Yoonia vestfoldensis]|uniref:NADH dehydrogenase subunit E n=1 Tax=Yoonia vestfoldensis TaxID=245188 RepID=A0A1Y0ECQ6_9RHOB|nr:NADH:ubiquinone oxidoreductase [Yoonia vestfoldensis]ARU01112.1 NADH dehydrogenase subunit E [Yoonia vestfoldensis]
MNNTAPIWMGIAAIAGLVFVIALGVAYILFDLGLNGAVFVAVIVAGGAGLALALGWRPARNDAAAAPAAPATPVAPAAPAAAVAPATPAAPVASPAEGKKPEMLAAARNGQPDNLKQLSGVGPKLEQTLHGMGIFHFDQIAAWGPQELAWMDANLQGFKGRASRDGWVAQAKALAEGA